MKFGLNDSTVKKIHHVFNSYDQVDKVIMYGSRAKGNYRTGSDIDLTLFGENLDQKLCAEIADDLDELLLPYMIDLSIFEQLKHFDLKQHIERVGQVFYQKKSD